MAELTAARNNVLAYPVYGLPYVVTFPILDADGDLVTGAAGLDSEVSKNGDTFADCTNEATEIATSSGIYYLSLTATEMTADIVTVIVKTSTTGAKTTTLTLYPVKLPSLLTGTAAAGAAGTITLANVAASLAVDDYFNGCLIYTTGGTGSGQARRISDYVGSTRVASVTPQWATTPDNTTTYEIYLTDTAVNALKANISAISDDATAADNCELMFDGTGYAGGAIKLDSNVVNWKGSAAPAMTGDAYAEAVAVHAHVDNILADTNELQTDWVNGGRLDLLIDAIKAKTDVIPASPAEVGSEMTLSSDYDAAKTAASQSSVDEILEDTGTTLPASISGIAASVWDYLTAAMTTAGSIGKALADWFDNAPPSLPPATASDVVICNNALSLLGNTTITTLTGETKASKLCAQFYHQTVNATLRAYTWNAATTRSAALTATTTPSFGFTNAFTLPTDCLRVLTIEDDETIKFKVEGSTILTDEATCKITYIKRIDIEEADSLLIEAISARLAATIAFALTNSTSTADAMWKLYKDKLDEAQTIDAFEGSAPQVAGSDWVNSRG